MAWPLSSTSAYEHRHWISRAAERRRAPLRATRGHMRRARYPALDIARADGAPAVGGLSVP